MRIRALFIFLALCVAALVFIRPPTERDKLLIEDVRPAAAIARPTWQLFTTCPIDHRNLPTPKPDDRRA